MKTRRYDVKDLNEGRTFEKAAVFTAFSNSSHWNSIEDQAREKFNRPDQFVKIDHVSRLIIVNY